MPRAAAASWFVIVISLLPLCKSVKFLLPAGKTDCITHNVPEGVQQVSGGLQLMGSWRGQEALVNVEVRDPNKGVVWAMPVRHEVEFVFKPRISGDYQVCFINKRDAVFSELVYVDFDRSRYASPEEGLTRPHAASAEHREALASERDVTSIRNQLYTLSSRLAALTGEQRLIKHRYEWQLEHARHMHSRTLWLTVVEVLALMVVGGLQVLLIRAMFSDGPGRGRRPVVKGLLSLGGGGGPTLPVARMHSRDTRF